MRFTLGITIKYIDRHPTASMTNNPPMDIAKIHRFTMSIFQMCCLDIPITITEQIVKYMRHRLWRKKDSEVHAIGNALIAWKKICRPKNQGGLGVLDLQVQNKALLLKNLHKFYNKHDIPWVNLVWNSYYNSGNLPRKRFEGSFW
jgi:hypothetical protein